MSEFLPINLPSKCLTYDVNPEDITIRPYQAKDEIFLAEINPINLESKYLQVLQNVIQGIDAKKLTLGDRFYIMIWECMNSYTEVIKVKMVCSHCLRDVQVEVDLTKLNLIELPDDFQQPYSVKLPVAGKEIKLRLFTVADELEIERYESNPNHEDGHLFRFAKSIVSDMDVMDRMNQLSKLKAKDLAKIRWFHQKFVHGPDMRTTVQCPVCKKEEDLEVPFRLDYLYPDGEALGDAFGEGI